MYEQVTNSISGVKLHRSEPKKNSAPPRYCYDSKGLLSDVHSSRHNSQNVDNGEIRNVVGDAGDTK